MVRIGIVGAGNHSSVHHGSSLQYLAMNEPDRVELCAVCDLDAEKARNYAREFGFARIYTDYNEMLRKESLDGLVAVTPVSATAPVAGDLLSRGIPLLIEKPPGTSSNETLELLASARRHQARHMISFNRRFIPAVSKAVAWTGRDGQSNETFVLVSRMLRNSRTEEDFIVGTGVHLIDTTLSLMGRPAEVRSRRWQTSSGGQCAEGEVIFSNGCGAVLLVLPDSGVNEETYELAGAGFSVCVESENCTLAVRHNGKQVIKWQPDAEMPFFERCGALDETRAFLDAITGAASFGPTLVDGLYAMQVAEALDRGGTTTIEQAPSL